MIHGEREISVDFPYVALAARAAGLDYLSLAQEWNLTFPTPARLEQACQAVSTGDLTLAWNMEVPKNYWRGNVSHCLGHGWTLAMRGCTPDERDAVAELKEMSAGDYQREKTPTPNFETHALIHSLGGIVSYTHPAREWGGKWGGQEGYPVEEHKFVSNLAKELPYDTLIGPTYDTIDILMRPEEKEVNEKLQRLWFMLLNKGYCIAGTASSDSTFDRPGEGVPGKVRVYTRVEGPLALPATASAMKAGRNFVTSGPLLLFSLSEHKPGDIVSVKGALTLKAELKAWASGEPGESLTRIEIIRAGKTVKTFHLHGHQEKFAIKFDLKEAGTAWYIARCWRSSENQVAITNPIYFEGEGFQAPKPTLARVTGTVTDKATGELLSGTCEIIEMVGLTPQIFARYSFEGGHFSVSVPGTSRVRVAIPGYLSETESIFMDYAPLRELILNLHSEQLIEWATFEKVRELLGEVKLHFALKQL